MNILKFFSFLNLLLQYRNGYSIFQAYLAQVDSSNSYTAQYPFDEYDNEYFTEQLCFSVTVKGGLEKTYCIAPDLYTNKVFL